jgi:serine/threonine protein kinase
MSDSLSAGSRILEGRYMLLRLLYTRPRVNLYLGWRLPREGGNQQQDRQRGLVAVRELVLDGLPAGARARVEQAAWEEFLSPGVVSALRLPATGATERLWTGVEQGRHYLVMRLFESQAAGSVVMPLADLLQRPRWPRWLETRVAVAWTIQLARVVARLHHQGTIPVDLDPSTIMIDASDRATKAAWSPLLLACWPPSPCFWSKRESVQAYFPLRFRRENVFAAPELLSRLYDERADVYALGAMLYLLLTGRAPVSATRRLLYARKQSDGLELASPRFFCPALSPALEDIVLHTLALEPHKRYPSVFTLVEALEEAQKSLDSQLA